MGSFEEPKMATFNAMRPSFFEGAVTFTVCPLWQYGLWSFQMGVQN